MIEQWLSEIRYSGITGIFDKAYDALQSFTVYDINGRCLASNAETMPVLHEGLYIVNSNKIYIQR